MNQSMCSVNVGVKTIFIINTETCFHRGKYPKTQIWNLFDRKGLYKCQPLPQWIVLFLKILFIYLLERREGREREREKHGSAASHTPPAGALACNPGWALTWNQNPNLSVCGTTPHPPVRAPVDLRRLEVGMLLKCFINAMSLALMHAVIRGCPPMAAALAILVVLLSMTFPMDLGTQVWKAWMIGGPKPKPDKTTKKWLYYHGENLAAYFREKPALKKPADKW